MKTPGLFPPLLIPLPTPFFFVAVKMHNERKAFYFVAFAPNAFMKKRCGSGAKDFPSLSRVR
jgi:hypothetical protein